jgi:hypothetical protein
MSETRKRRLTKRMLEAMASAINSALAGEGWNGGDFDGMDHEEFERAAEWIDQQIARRTAKAKQP